MKKSSLFLCLGAALSSALWAEPKSVSVPAEHIYAPKGFDTNDMTQVIVAGNLPNLCYKSPSSTFEIKEHVISIKLNALYEEVEGTVCGEATVPFLETVSVGVLEEGVYDVKVNEGEASGFLQDQITVVKTSNLEVNDHIYARVDSIERPDDKERKVLLKGYNPSDCFELDEIRHISNEKDTYSVLPIMRQTRAFCPRKMMPFTYEWTVPEELKADEVLLHVRTMLGSSKNFLFNNKVEESAK